MAVLHEVSWANRRECLEAFARVFGEHPPRSPIPDWWRHFSKWYEETGAQDSVLLRTEAMEWDDEDDEAGVPLWRVFENDDDGPSESDIEQMEVSRLEEEPDGS
jgi:hypothetical protein